MFAEYYFFFYNGKHDSNAMTSAYYQTLKRNYVEEYNNECIDGNCIQYETINENLVCTYLLT